MMASMPMRRSPWRPLIALPVREILRAPITFLLSSTTVCATLCIPLVLAFHFGDTGRRLVRDGGLALQLSAGIILAAASACNLIRRERESGVAALLLTKPVARHSYLLSRFAGIAGVLIVFSISALLANLLAHRAAETFSPGTGYRTDATAALLGILCLPLACATAGWLNWRRNFSFHAVATLALPLYLLITCLMMGFLSRDGTLTWPYHPQLDLRIVVAAAALLLPLLVFAAIALTASIRLQPVTTVMLCLIVLFAGLFAPLGIARTNLLRPLATLIPNWNWFWLASHLDDASRSLLTASVFATLYGTTLLGAILLLAMHLMQTVEVPT